MKKNILTIFALFALASCSVNAGSDVSYDNSDKYSYGNKTFTESISSLFAGFVCGDLNISKADTLSLSETGKHDELTSVHYLLDGEKLYLHDTGAGKISSFSYEKKVSLTVPNALSKMELNCVSGNFVSNINVEEVEFYGTSGSFSLTSTTLKKLDIEIVSGNVELYIPKGKGLDIDNNTVTGEIEGSYQEGNDIEIFFTSVSGDLIIHQIEG